VIDDVPVHATHLFAGLAVTDFTAACDWYERLFDGPPIAYPRDGEALWRAAESASVYVTADGARAGHGLLTLAVQDIDSQRADLARRGLRAEEGAERNGIRTLIVTDPDGNTIKFFEDPGGR
jgi:catechol 2,3-dioxygenase-like lactoylglutathione lyase family enzyme